jgi:hypothetical protein
LPGLWNECQKLPLQALINGIFGTADKGGISLLTSNPPRRQVGEWVLHLKTAIENKRIRGAKFFPFAPDGNERVDQGARERIAEIVRTLDPKAAQADDEGAWLPVGDRAYPKWDPRTIEEGGLVGPPPTEGNVTGEALKKAGIYKQGMLYVCGGDFQGRPHQAGVVLQVFKREDGKYLYWVVDEMIVEGTERQLSAEAFDRGYKPETMVWIPDATGEFQDAKHTKRETSFDILKADRWLVYPPNEIKRPESIAAANPRVERRLAMMWQLMDERRFFIAPACEWLIEAFEKCPLGNAKYGGKKPYGKYSHATDAGSYPCWRLEEKAKPPQRPLRPGDVRSLEVRRGPGNDLFPGMRNLGPWRPL